MDLHSPAKTKVTLANAQKFIHLRRQEVPLKEAVKLSAKKIRDTERQDIDMLLKQVTLLKFSEEHYDYEHITKQYEHFENTHNIVNGLILTDNNQGYANEMLDQRVIELTKSPDRGAIIRRRRVNDLKLFQRKHDFKEKLRTKHKRSEKSGDSDTIIEGQMKAFSKYAARWNDHPAPTRRPSEIPLDSRRASKLGLESFLGSIAPSRKNSVSSTKFFGKLPVLT